MRRISVATSTRADWGLLRPVCRELVRRGVKVNIIATNMHLMPRYGHTVDEITADGFDVAWRVPIDAEGDDDASRALAMSLCLRGMAQAFASLAPDAVIILGDRYEMLATASAAAAMHIPIVHIAGGEITVGALDDVFRHAITKLSHLHLTATDDYRRRVIQMGEAPDAVVNTGAIGVWNAFNAPRASDAELREFLGVDASARLVAVTYHPATHDSAASPRARFEALLEAMDAFPKLTYVVTAPNNDAGGNSLLACASDYAARRPDNVRLVASLGMRRYMQLLHSAVMVLGNSSSGIVEAPSAGTPTVDIGIRQQGRISAPSIIHCGDSTADIVAAMRKALSPEMQLIASRKENPYAGNGDTLTLMVDAVVAFLDALPAKPKVFYDLPQ